MKSNHGFVDNIEKELMYLNMRMEDKAKQTDLEILVKRIDEFQEIEHQMELKNVLLPKMHKFSGEIEFFNR